MQAATQSLDASAEYEHCADFPAQQAQRFVRMTPQALSEASDAELQTYISGCAEQFLAAQHSWEATGCFGDIGLRDYWWQAEVDALVERGGRPHIVRAMERERGLA